MCVMCDKWVLWQRCEMLCIHQMTTKHQAICRKCESQQKFICKHHVYLSPFTNTNNNKHCSNTLLRRFESQTKLNEENKRNGLDQYVIILLIDVIWSCWVWRIAPFANGDGHWRHFGRDILKIHELKSSNSTDFCRMKSNFQTQLPNFNSIPQNKYDLIAVMHYTSCFSTRSIVIVTRLRCSFTRSRLTLREPSCCCCMGGVWVCMRRRRSSLHPFFVCLPPCSGMCAAASVPLKCFSAVCSIVFLFSVLFASC